ncbi:MAG: M20/M25/M40 family metallo-hydrolase [Candidatus ainarchaeum sp.]|nr:M20/M25/M40 family metallo-hydrolase [Candidatus ainarchaeum sp.]
MDAELGFLARLVALDTDSTTKKNYSECAELVAREARKYGFRAKIFDAKRLAGDGKPRPNVVVYFDAGAKQTLLIAAHYDVVPAGEGWTRPPFRLTVEGGRAYGRGANDDKAGIVAALYALKRLKETGDSKVNVKLLVTCDEEVSSELGLGYLMNGVKVKGDAGLVLDASRELLVGASGVCYGKVVVKGKQGHAGSPHRAKNAISLMLPLLVDLEKFSRVRARHVSRFLAPPMSPKKRVWGRFSITMLRAGEKENVIPGEAEARFDLRLLPEEDPGKAVGELKRYFEEIRGKRGVDARIEVKASSRGYFTDPGHPFARNFARIIGARNAYATLGGNDGHFFARRGLPVVAYGAGGWNCGVHGKDEFVWVKEIYGVGDDVARLCREWEGI